MRLRWRMPGRALAALAAAAGAAGAGAGRQAARASRCRTRSWNCGSEMQVLRQQVGGRRAADRRSAAPTADSARRRRPRGGPDRRSCSTGCSRLEERGARACAGGSTSANNTRQQQDARPEQADRRPDVQAGDATRGRARRTGDPRRPGAGGAGRRRLAAATPPTAPVPTPPPPPPRRAAAQAHAGSRVQEGNAALARRDYARGRGGRHARCWPTARGRAPTTRSSCWPQALAGKRDYSARRDRLRRLPTTAPHGHPRRRTRCSGWPTR